MAAKVCYPGSPTEIHATDRPALAHSTKSWIRMVTILALVLTPFFARAEGDGCRLDRPPFEELRGASWKRDPAPENLAGEDEIRDSAHFRIHYRTSGPDQVLGWPELAYVDTMLAAFERSYETHQRIGLPVAPRDGTIGGGRDLSDCYVRDTGDEFAGSAGTDSCWRNGAVWTCTGSMFLDNDLSPALLRNVASHEYFHLVQYGLDPQESKWFLESTATWGERPVHPQETVYANQTSHFLLQPHLALTSRVGLREYGSVIYWVMNEEMLDPDFVTEVWLRARETDWRNALEEQLAEHGLTFEASLCSLSVWNDTAGTRDDGLHYRDARSYNTMKAINHGEFPVQATRIEHGRRAWPEGAHNLRFAGPGQQQRLTVRFRQPPDQEPYRSVIGMRRGSDQGRDRLEPRMEDGWMVFDVEDWREAQDVTLLLTHFEGIDEEADYEYSAVESGMPASRQVLSLTATPNPFRDETILRGWSLGAAGPAMMRIFDARGRLVRRWNLGEQPPGALKLEWDGRDEQGWALASGIYFLELQYGEASNRGRIAILR